MSKTVSSAAVSRHHRGKQSGAVWERVARSGRTNDHRTWAFFLSSQSAMQAIALNRGFREENTSTLGSRKETQSLNNRFFRRLLYKLIMCAGCLRNPFSIQFTSIDIQHSHDNTYNIHHNTYITQHTHHTDTTQTRTSLPPSVVFMMIHDNLLIACGDTSFTWRLGNGGHL